MWPSCWISFRSRFYKDTYLKTLWISITSHRFYTVPRFYKIIYNEHNIMVWRLFLFSKHVLIDVQNDGAVGIIVWPRFRYYGDLKILNLSRGLTSKVSLSFKIWSGNKLKIFNNFKLNGKIREHSACRVLDCTFIPNICNIKNVDKNTPLYCLYT